jgi:hypothetical protein
MGKEGQRLSFLQMVKNPDTSSQNRCAHSIVNNLYFIKNISNFYNSMSLLLPA